jgi:hypothetical protein
MAQQYNQLLVLIIYSESGGPAIATECAAAGMNIALRFCLIYIHIRAGYMRKKTRV